MEQNFGGVALSKRVGNYLKRQLANKKGARAKFAEDFCIEERTLRRWISDGVQKIDVIDEIAYYFGVDIRDIFSDDEDVPLLFSEQIQKAPAEPKTLRVLFFYRTFSALSIFEKNRYNKNRQQKRRTKTGGKKHEKQCPNRIHRPVRAQHQTLPRTLRL